MTSRVVLLPEGTLHRASRGRPEPQVVEEVEEEPRLLTPEPTVAQDVRSGDEPRRVLECIPPHEEESKVQEEGRPPTVVTLQGLQPPPCRHGRQEVGGQSEPVEPRDVVGWTEEEVGWVEEDELQGPVAPVEEGSPQEEDLRVRPASEYPQGKRLR